MHFLGKNVLLGLVLVAVHSDASFFSECGFNAAHKEPSYRPHSALLKDPPRYPREALKRGTEGFVLVEFTVTEEGSVADCQFDSFMKEGLLLGGWLDNWHLG